MDIHLALRVIIISVGLAYFLVPAILDWRQT